MRLLLLFSLSILTSCATYQSDKYVDVVEGEHQENVGITAEVDTTLSTDEFKVIQFNFGNFTDEWVRVKSVNIDMGDKALDEKVQLVIGDDISTWGESIKHKIAVDKWNRDMLLGVLMTAGLAATAIDNKGVQILGVSTAVVSSSIAVANDVMDKLDNMQRASLFPASHVYRPFSVPMNLHTKRWVLLQTKDKELPEYVYFNVEYLNGKTARYRISI